MNCDRPVILTIFFCSNKVPRDNWFGRIPIHLSVAKPNDSFRYLFECTGLGASYQRIAEYPARCPMHFLQSNTNHRHSLQMSAMPKAVAVLWMLLQGLYEFQARDFSSNVWNEHHCKFHHQPRISNASMNTICHIFSELNRINFIQLPRNSGAVLAASLAIRLKHRTKIT